MCNARHCTWAHLASVLITTVRYGAALLMFLELIYDVFVADLLDLCAAFNNIAQKAIETNCACVIAVVLCFISYPT